MIQSATTRARKNPYSGSVNPFTPRRLPRRNSQVVVKLPEAGGVLRVVEVGASLCYCASEER